MIVAVITAAVEDAAHAHRLWCDVCNMFLDQKTGALTMETRSPTEEDLAIIDEISGPICDSCGTILGSPGDTEHTCRTCVKGTDDVPTVHDGVHRHGLTERVPEPGDDRA